MCWGQILPVNFSAMRIRWAKISNWATSGLRLQEFFRQRHSLQRLSVNWLHAILIMMSIFPFQPSEKDPKDKYPYKRTKQVTIKLDSSERLIESAAVIRSIISRRHFNNDDFSIIIPYELMEQEKRRAGFTIFCWRQ